MSSPNHLRAWRLRHEELVQECAREQLAVQAQHGRTIALTSRRGGPIVPTGRVATTMQQRPWALARLVSMLFLVLVALLGSGALGLPSPGAEALESNAGSRGPSIHDPLAGCATAGNAAPTGTVLTTLLIPADGAMVRTPVLTAGQPYRLRVSGVMTTNVGTKLGVLAIDAGYFFFTRDGAATPGADRLDGVDVGLTMVDGAGSADHSATWGAFCATHVYQRDVVGQGQPLVLRFQGSTWQTIGGDLRVEIAQI